MTISAEGNILRPAGDIPYDIILIKPVIPGQPGAVPRHGMLIIRLDLFIRAGVIPDAELVHPPFEAATVMTCPEMRDHKIVVPLLAL